MAEYNCRGESIVAEVQTSRVLMRFVSRGVQRNRTRVRMDCTEMKGKGFSRMSYSI